MEASLQRLRLIESHLTSFEGCADPLILTQLDKLFSPESNAKRLDFRATLDNSRGLFNESYEKANDFGLYKQLYKKLGFEAIGNWQDEAAFKYEVSRADASFMLGIGVHRYLVCDSILTLGSAEQKAKYLPSLLKGDKFGCWCLTEPDAGSDASSLEIEAKPTEGGYLLNGFKKWPGNSSFADLMIVFARCTVTGEVIGLIVQGADEGIKIENIQHKLSHRGVLNGNVEFLNVFVPQSDKLEKANDFESGPAVILSRSRSTISWGAVGIIAGVYETTVKRLALRQSVRNLPIVRAKLCRILSLFTGSFLMLFNFVKRTQSSATTTIGQASMVKAEISKMASEATRLASDVLQEEGLTLDNYIIKALADNEVYVTGEGTYEICMLVAGRELTGLSSFKPSR